MKNITILLLLLIPVIIFSGCAVGPDFQTPVAEVPDAYHYDSQSSESVIDPVIDLAIDLEWWTLFDDPRLDALVSTALQENKNILIAAARLEEAMTNLSFTKADLYPQLDLQASAGRGNLINGQRSPNEQNAFYIAPVVSWEIDFWGKYRRSTEAARAEMMASEYGYQAAQLSLVSEVVSTYFLLLDFEHRLEVSKRTLTLREKSLDIIEKRFDKGIIAEIDVHQARIQREIAAAAIPVFERSIVKTENALSILLGRLPAEFETETGRDQLISPPNIPIGLPSQLLERRPDIAQSEAALHAQTARIGIAKSLMFPAISLTGLFGYASNDLSKLTSDGLGWSVTGSLFSPLFNWKKNINRVEIEKIRTEQALLQYENTVLSAFREVKDALIDVKTYKAQAQAKKRELTSAAKAAELSQMRYDKGVTSYIEVLEAERSLFNVELQYSEIRQEYNNAYVKLYKSLGGGWDISKQITLPASTQKAAAEE
ncbi:MAG: efflux transporter outer membrane subunit [Desulfobacteraceae bacterium]|nr:efflux transporter outer membrane subunit [Desulfobacteraceae bacterium]MBC2755441.1 efflux transporter outer membrane subunit [Desulfobacteraceae bacterium]